MPMSRPRNTDALLLSRLLWRLPNSPTHEKRPESVQVHRRLLRLSHGLDDGRERIQIFPKETDHEVVVVLVQPVAGQSDVVGVVAGAKRHSNCAMFGQD